MLGQAAESLPRSIRLGEVRKVIDQTDLGEWSSSKKYTWQKFSMQPQRGDCVVAFETATDPNAPLNGDAKGFLLVRRGKVLDSLVTEIK
jgi:hypothetical protein